MHITKTARKHCVLPHSHPRKQLNRSEKGRAQYDPSQNETLQIINENLSPWNNQLHKMFI